MNTMNDTTPLAVQFTEAIVKSENDKRHYRLLTLPNQLQALLVSDPVADKAAASMDVLVGHFQDPEALPGLAHFCEHMLFLGTEKYPDESSYGTFLSEHGGRSNAFTGTESTNYFFDVAYEHLEGALDRFAQFFIAPLFTPEATEREMKAVDSENAKNLQADGWRQYQLLKSSANAKHPFSKFGSGNLYTLNECPKEKGYDVRAELLAFHKTYYSANVMKLAVLGRESLDDLQKLVVDKFSQVKNINRPRVVNKPEVVPFGPEELGWLYRVVPVKDLRDLVLIFPLPALDEYYLTSPEDYLSHLVGHEGPGSLLSLLKEKGYANELTAGGSRTASDFGLFKVTIKLTEKGLANYEEIVTMCFQYIKMLREEKVQEWIFDEVRRVQEIDFKFKEEETPYEYVSSLSQDMQLYPPEHILSGPHLMPLYNPERITEILEKLSPSNLRIHLISKTFQPIVTEKERWYKTEYIRERFSEEMINKWNNPGVEPALHLPAVNEFIPTRFDILPSSKEDPTYPIKVRSDPLCTVWHKQDKTFLLPKADIRATLLTPYAVNSPRNAVLTNLYNKLLEDSLNEYAYFADIAGLEFSLSVKPNGLGLRVNGYQEKLPLLLERIVKRMVDLEVKPDRFTVIKEKVKRSYQNFFMEQPWEHGRYEAEVILTNRRWQVTEKIEAIEELTHTDLQEFIVPLLKHVYIEMLIMGNVVKDDALAIGSIFVDIIKPSVLRPTMFPERRVLRLTEKTTFSFQKKGPNPANPNSALYTYYQVGEHKVSTSALLGVLAQICDEPAFDQLRTKEQLGYLVWSGTKTLYGVSGFRFVVQSAVKPPRHLEERVEVFLDKLREIINNMTEENFQKYKNAVISKLEEKDKTLEKECRRYWNEIESFQYLFNRSEVTVREIKEKVTKERLLQFFDSFFVFEGASRSKLTIHVYGNKFNLDGTPATTENKQEGEKEKAEESDDEEEDESDSDDDEEDEKEKGKQENAEEKKEREERERKKVELLRATEKRVSLNDVDIGLWKKTMPLFPEQPQNE